MPEPLDLDDDDRMELAAVLREQGKRPEAEALYQEVAAALGLTEAAASMRYLRAIRRLRELMAPS